MNNDVFKISPKDRLHKSNMIIKDFINELGTYLDKVHSNKLIFSLPKTTILTFAKFDENFAVCFDYKDKKIYYLSKDNIFGNLPKPGEALKFYSDDKLYVDYTAILANENKIDDYLKECTIAK